MSRVDYAALTEFNRRTAAKHEVAVHDAFSSLKNVGCFVLKFEGPATDVLSAVYAYHSKTSSQSDILQSAMSADKLRRLTGKQSNREVPGRTHPLTQDCPEQKTLEAQRALDGIARDVLFGLGFESAADSLPSVEGPLPALGTLSNEAMTGGQQSWAQSDVGVLTLVFSPWGDTVEAFNPKRQEWVAIETSADEVLVMAGFTLQYLSEGSVVACHYRQRGRTSGVGRFMTLRVCADKTKRGVVGDDLPATPTLPQALSPRALPAQAFPPQALPRPAKMTTGQDPTSGMSIFVKTLTGQIHALCVPETLLVDELMGRLEEVTGWPVDQQRLIFCGKQLEKQRTLEEYNIRNESTLHLVTRLKGD